MNAPKDDLEQIIWQNVAEAVTASINAPDGVTDTSEATTARVKNIMKAVRATQRKEYQKGYQKACKTTASRYRKAPVVPASSLCDDCLEKANAYKNK